MTPSLVNKITDPLTQLLKSEYLNLRNNLQ